MSNFIVDRVGPHGLACVFEDDGETGYLYLYDQDGGVIEDLQIYTRAQELNVEEQDVDVVWSSDGNKCGVLVWNGMRGIIDIKQNEKARSMLESRDSLRLAILNCFKAFSRGFTDGSVTETENCLELGLPWAPLAMI